jgi:RibD C-terminal domain
VRLVGGKLSPQLTAFFASAPILASLAAVNFLSAKATGHTAPSSRFAASLKPNVAYLVLNFFELWKKQTTLPSLAYAGIPYQRIGPVGTGGAGAMLMGRRSYEGMLASWNAKGGPFEDALNAAPKYVASSTPSTRLVWPNSILLHGDVPEAVAKLKREQEGDLLIMGSGALIHSLVPHNLKQTPSLTRRGSFACQILLSARIFSQAR